MCGSLGWGGSQNGNYSLIGYNINKESAAFSDLPSFANHRLSGLPNVESIACQKLRQGTLWNSLIYKVGESKDVVQMSRTECLRISNNDIVLVSINIELRTTCPCTSDQARRDTSYTRVNMFSLTGDPDYARYNCFTLEFGTNIFTSLCCYR